MERLAERDGDAPVAVPAQFDDGALRPQQLQRAGEARLRRAGVHDEVEAVEGVGGGREADAQRVGDLRPVRVGVDQLDADAREPGQQRGHRAADHAPADHGDPVADQGRSVPQRVDGGLHGSGEHGPPGGDGRGHGGDGGGRDDVPRLVGVQAEDGAPDEIPGPLLHDADVEVPVLHRSREVALLERRAHGGVLALGHPAAEDERLGAPADAAEERAHEHLVRRRLGQAHLADHAPAGRVEPERACGACHRMSS